MEEIFRSYVEIQNIDCSIIKESERNPLEINYEKGMQGFRFHDCEYFIDGKRIYMGEKVNSSNWIYFGERISLDKIKKEYGNNPEYRELINLMECNNNQFVCRTKEGTFIIMQDVDMTYEEFEISRGKSRERTK